MLGLTRPFEIAESTPLLLGMAALGLGLATVACFKAMSACLVLTIAAASASFVYLTVEPVLAPVPLAVLAAEIAVLIWLRPWERAPSEVCFRCSLSCTHRSSWRGRSVAWWV